MWGLGPPGRDFAQDSSPAPSGSLTRDVRSSCGQREASPLPPSLLSASLSGPAPHPLLGPCNGETRPGACPLWDLRQVFCLGTQFGLLANGSVSTPASSCWGSFTRGRSEGVRLESLGAAVRVPPDLTCGGLSNSAGWYMEHHPTAQKGKLSLRGAGLVKVVTLRGRGWKDTQVPPTPLSLCSRWKNGFGPRQDWQRERERECWRCLV